MPYPGKTPFFLVFITFSLGNTKKNQEISSNIRKYLKSYEIPGNTRPKTWNTKKYFVKNMKYFGIFTRFSFDLSFFADWVLTILLFLLGYMKFKQEILWNTRKYFANNMKYQEILENSRKASAALGFIKATETLRKKPRNPWKSLNFSEKSWKIINIFIKVPHFSGSVLKKPRYV
jgi:hypothetical protein